MSRKPKINPLKIYRVDPDKINFTHAVEKPELDSIFLSPIIGGNWDKRVNKLEDYDVIYSLEKHFRDNKDWKDTDYYLRAQETIERGEEWVGRGSYNSIEGFESYLGGIDHLYSLIKSEGFKSQKELCEEGLESRVHVHKAIGLDEVTVSIGRDGKLIHEDGWHRLAISKALNLNEIPVRIKVRHKKWQEKRKKSLEEGEPVVESHPDLQELFEDS